MKSSYVYILASKKRGTLYIGITSNLIKRVWEHKEKLVKGFTQKYNINQLVYYEVFSDISYAIEREKNLKEWKRAWKIRMIEERNLEWKDLYNKLIQ